MVLKYLASIYRLRRASTQDCSPVICQGGARDLRLGPSSAYPIMSKYSLIGIIATSCAMLGCSGGGAASKSTAPPTVPTVVLTASPSSVSANSSSTLTWSTTNATSCTASGGWSGPQNQNGSAPTGPLAATSNYTLSCTGPGGSGSAAVTVTVTSVTGVTVSPSTAPLTLQQTQQFSATVTGGGGVTWSVDGMVGGTSAVGTISTAGLYSPPSSGVAGSHLISATSIANPAYSGSATVVIADLAGVYTYHNDVGRTGQNLQEYALTPAVVSGGKFGRRWTCPLDGDSPTQPLYVALLSVGGNLHNVLFVTTQHDSVYAFDADNGSCAPLWHVNLLASGESTIPSTDMANCYDIIGEFGITGTPVIDPVSQTLYVVAASKKGTNYFQRLHALNIATGAERNGSPATINASVTLSGGTVLSFDPLRENQRPALALTGGGIFIGWSGHCDLDPYWGWFMRYDATSLQQTAVFNDTPNGVLGGGYSGEGGIWMSGGAPAIDSSGSMFLTTGNGTFDNTMSVLPPLAPNNDFAMSFLNLDTTTLAVKDFYTPMDEMTWSINDWDISSGGVTVIPDGQGSAAHPNLLAGGDKQGNFWLLDRTSLGLYSALTNNVVQLATLPGSTLCSDNCVFSTPAYYGGTVYIGTSIGQMVALKLTNGTFPVNAQKALIASSVSTESYSFPGPTPSISASPGGGAIVWTLDNRAATTQTQAAGPAVLRAYDAANLGTTLYSSDTLAADTAGNAVKFTVPLVANGRVYVVGGGQLTVYGIAP